MKKDVFVAIGMVGAPAGLERRMQVRETMLQYEAVRLGSMVFRFVLGKELLTLERPNAKRLLAVCCNICR